MHPADDLRASTVKFSYFMAGIAGAALVFSVQTYSAPSPGYLKYGYAAAWLCYLLSLAASIQRLTINLNALRIEALNERQQEKARALEEGKLRGAVIYKTATEVWTDAEIEEVMKHSKTIEQVFEKTFAERNKEMSRSFNVANYCFILGAGIHGAVKIVSL